MASKPDRQVPPHAFPNCPAVDPSYWAGCRLPGVMPPIPSRSALAAARLTAGRAGTIKAPAAFTMVEGMA